MRSGPAPIDRAGVPGGLARAGLFVAGAVLASRLLGWLRVVIITATFGATPELDAYFAAFRVPDALFQLVAGGVLSSVLIPEIVRRQGRHAGEAWRMVTAVGSILVGGLSLLLVLAALFAPQLTAAIAPGFSGEQQELMVDLTRLMLISPLCFLIGAVAASVLNAEGRFGAAAVAPIAYNGAIIVASLTLAPWMGVHGLAIGVVSGAILFAVVQIAFAFRRTSFALHRVGPGMLSDALDVLPRLGPRTIGLAGTQMVLIVTTMLATGMGTGAVTAYTLAFTTLTIPVGLVGVPLGIVIFPSLARASADGLAAEYRRLLHVALRMALWVAAPIVAAGIVLAPEITTSLFGHGAIGAGTLATVAATVTWFFLGVPAHSMNLVLARAFYAVQDTRTPVLLALCQTVVAVGSASLASTWIGVPGIAAGVALGAWVKAVALAAILDRRGLLRGGDVVRRLPALALLATIGGVSAWGSAAAIDAVLGEPGIGSALATTLVGGSVLFGTFAAGSAMLRMPELDSSRDVVRRGLESVRRRISGRSRGE